MDEEERPPDAADDDVGAVEAATERAEAAWWWVAALTALLALHLSTEGWNQPWLAAGFTLMLLLRIRDAVRARRAEQAALRDWTPPSPWRRDRRRRGR